MFYRKAKLQSGMDNQEVLATLGTQDTGQRKKNKTKNKNNTTQHNTTQHNTEN